MANSLIEHKRINTTVAKAKALRGFVEPLITKSKNDSTHSRRTVFSYLKNKDAVSVLFRDIAPKVATRNGGYTRIIRTGYRLGDNAEMCMIELVDFNELLLAAAAPKKTTRRSRKPAGAKTSESVSNEEGVVDATTEESSDTPESSTEESTEENN
jgi:large subunit ribosomal protein L17